MAGHTLSTEITYLITGAAGFIGFHLCRSMLEQGCRIIGVDNINDYYDVSLKESRIDILNEYKSFTFLKTDISHKDKVSHIFDEYRPHIVVNLAAQAGVRYSLENPDAYIESNINGFFNLLEACRHYPVKHLIYASSSSVYGGNKKVPFEEKDATDHPVSLYAATKKSNELMAYTYSHLYGMPATGLRFFTVYGPMGRPDMSYFLFADSYFKGIPINIYNNGDFQNDLYRDFTYIDDIIEGISLVLEKPPIDKVPHRIYNIGNNKPEKLMTFIDTLEKSLSRAVKREVVFQKVFQPIKQGDVPATYASIDMLQKDTGFTPKTSIEQGLQKFADWYVEYYKIKLH